MLDHLTGLDTRLFRLINGHPHPLADWTLWTLGQHWCWAVVLALFFVLVVLRTKSKAWWLIVAGVALCFLLADQGSVLLFKNIVCRPRPCYALDDVLMFRTRCGSPYGFVSSHAANAFAVAIFLLMQYRKKPVAGWLMVAWAILQGYSRIYLGKHYPGDVLGGALFGIVVGLLVYWLTSIIEKKWHKVGTK